jgi:hypothetical protein
MHSATEIMIRHKELEIKLAGQYNEMCKLIKPVLDIVYFMTISSAYHSAMQKALGDA